MALADQVVSGDKVVHIAGGVQATVVRIDHDRETITLNDSDLGDHTISTAAFDFDYDLDCS